jgi:CRP-like cAMP-binding protein
MKQNELVQTLQEIRFLHDISNVHLAELASVAAVRDFERQQVVFREGDAAAHVYLVVSGNVSLEICASSIGCKRILTAGPGELLGWSALLDDARLTATARTTEASRLVELDAARLLSICQQNLEFGFEIMRRTLLAVTKRLNATRMQLLDVYGSQLPAAATTEGHDGR